MKFCGRCQTFKPITEYQKNRATKDGYQWQCKSCRGVTDKREGRLEYHRARYHNNKASYLDAQYKRKYGISLAEYDIKFAAQGGVCEICKRACPTGRRLSVDHSHASGKVRGLLCYRCNSGIADFQDNPAFLTAAMEYLERHK